MIVRRCDQCGADLTTDTDATGGLELRSPFGAIEVVPKRVKGHVCRDCLIEAVSGQRHPQAGGILPIRRAQ